MFLCSLTFIHTQRESTMHKSGPSQTQPTTSNRKQEIRALDEDTGDIGAGDEDAENT